MLSLRHLLLAFAAVLSAAMPAAWGAVEIADAQVTNIGTTTFTVVWTTSEVSTPALEVYSDAAGTNAITNTLGLQYYPIAEGDPALINTTAARAGQRALELLAINRRVVVVRVSSVATGTTYFVRPRTFGSDGVDNGSGLVALKQVTTAQFSSFVGDGRLVRIRFPAFSAEGMVALVEGPTGGTILSAIVGDSTDADSAVFPLANLLDAASGTNALFNAPQTISVRVIGGGAPTGTFTRMISFGTTFNVANYESIDADLTSPAPFVTAQPANRTVLLGAATTFTVAATGTPAPSYKWQRQPAATTTWGDLVDGSGYSGVTTATLTVTGTTMDMSGDQFRAIASNGVLPDATSAVATLTVVATTVAPSITAQPQPWSAVVGGNATFSVAVSGTPTPTVTWQRQPAGSTTWGDIPVGAPYSGGTTTTLTVTGATLAMSGDQFRAIAANGVAPDATSNAAALTVNVVTVAPSITTQPVSATVNAGTNATFSVVASGTPTPALKWQRQPAGSTTWSDISEGAPYSGVTTTTLTVNGATTAMSGDQFRAIASNGVAPDVTSNAATLTANAVTVSPSITTQPQPWSAVVGGNATFTVAVSGTPTPTVKWQRQPAGSTTWSDVVEGAPYSGVATTTLTVTGATLAMSGDQFRAIATNGVAPDATSNAATLTVSVVTVAPLITTQPQPWTAVVAGNATFSVAVSGTPTPTVTWQRQPAGSTTWGDIPVGAPYSGGTTTTLAVTGATLAMSGDQFRAIASNGVMPDAMSNAATLTVNLLAVAPSITTQPVSETALAGGIATFTVGVSGTPPPAVKWQRQPAGSGTWSDIIEAAPYSDVATATLTVTGLTLAMSGDQFRALASNGVVPDATSNAATLTVSAVPVAPLITAQPVSVTILTGADAAFTVAASGTPTPAVKWQRQPAGSTTWTDLVEVAPYSGVATTRLTVTGATLAMSGDQLRAIASNGVVPDAASNPATLTVSAIVVPPSITTRPQSLAANAGDTVTFTVAASGTPSPSYRWQYMPAGGSTWAELANGSVYSGVATATLTVSGTTIGMTGDQFRAVAFNGALAEATSGAATLVVIAVNGPPAIMVQPQSTAVTLGTPATFTVTVSGTPLPGVTWQRQPAGSVVWSNLANGPVYSGVATSTLSVNGTTLAMSGDKFRAVAANGVPPDATSEAATLTVNAGTLAPAITTQPSSTTVTTGGIARFTVEASGTPTPGLRWQRQPAGGTTWGDLADSSPYSGVTTTTLTVTGATFAMSGDLFRAFASNGVGPDATSAAATLTVNAIVIPPIITPPVITSQPASETVTAGASVTFVVQVAGVTPITYQWSKNGSAIIRATSSTLTLNNVQLSDAGTYAVVVSNVGGMATSRGATLVVTAVRPPPPAVAPIIEVQPASVSFASGSAVSFSVSASGALPLMYQWYKDGTAINGATGATLAIARASIPSAGRYYVVVSNALGSVTSRVALLSLRFAGTYFGNFGGNRGRFSLYIRGDGTGVFLGYDHGNRIALINLNVVIDDNGRFHVVVRGGAAAPTLTLSVYSPPRTAAEVEYQIDGSIAESGTVSGTVSGLDLTFSAPSPAPVGATNTVAGFYQAGVIGSSATSYTILGSAGGAFILTTTGATTDAGQGTVTAAGVLDVTTDNNARVTGTVQVDTAIISATVITATGASLTFVGANNDVRAEIEKLVNVSTRTQTGTASRTLIAGFVISGTERKPVLVRAVGPTLARFNVTDPLGAARIEIFRDQALVGAGGDWGAAANASAVAAAAARVGAFELPENSRDAALLLSLEPGAYTAQVTGQDSATGVSLVEVYDATEGDIPRSQRIVNVSTRAMAGTGDNTLIAGFVINGSIPKKVLIRGAGPSLAQFGVTGGLGRPQLTVFLGSTAIAHNAGWSTTPEALAIAEAATQVGAFAFAAGSQDAALILNLAPGAYTAQATGVDDATGVALIEVYEIP